MFNKKLLASITLDKRRLAKSIKNSCTIECIPSINTLDNEEKEALYRYLNSACDLLRISYIRYMSSKNIEALSRKCKSYEQKK